MPIKIFFESPRLHNILDSTFITNKSHSCLLRPTIYADGEKRYIIAPNKLQVGDVVLSGKGIAPDLGNCMPIGDMPIGRMPIEDMPVGRMPIGDPLK